MSLRERSQIVGVLTSCPVELLVSSNLVNQELEHFGGKFRWKFSTGNSKTATDYNANDLYSNFGFFLWWYDFNSSMKELSEADRNFQEVTIEIRL